MRGEVITTGEAVCVRFDLGSAMITADRGRPSLALRRDQGREDYSCEGSWATAELHHPPSKDGFAAWLLQATKSGGYGHKNPLEQRKPIRSCQRRASVASDQILLSSSSHCFTKHSLKSELEKSEGV